MFSHGVDRKYCVFKVKKHCSVKRKDENVIEWMNLSGKLLLYV